jgi:hypothetical protein
LVLVAGDGGLGCGTDRINDVLVAGAPAEVALEPGANAFLARLWLTLQQFQRAHDHAGGAKAALQRVMLTKRRQQRMRHRTRPAQALEGGNGRAVRLDRQDRARLHRAAVQVHRARAALGGVASDMHAGDAEVLSQQLHQPRSRLDLGLPPLTIDGESDLMT